MTLRKKNSDQINFLRILVKVIIILTLINFGWVFVPDSIPAHLNTYNWLVRGRERLPFGDNPERSYNLSLYNLDAMVASHKISKNNSLSVDEYRIFLIGDSSVWGFLQKPEETLSGLLGDDFSEMGISVYNLGYPSISILKDALIIDYAMQFEPDLIIWLTTLEALPSQKQLTVPIVENNVHKINRLINNYSLPEFRTENPSYLERTFWAQRRNFFDVIRLQILGLLWDATGIDQEYPETYRDAQRDFPDPISDYYGVVASEDLRDSLSLDVIGKTVWENKNTDFLVINEPILISKGENAHLQYNFYYPVWAYDAYREIINTYTFENGIEYYDLWDIVPQEEFTNSAIHLSARGERLLADEIHDIIIDHIGDELN